MNFEKNEPLNNKYEEQINPLLRHLQTISDLIKELGLSEHEEERRLNELNKLKQELFSQPVNSESEAEILRKIDKLLLEEESTEREWESKGEGFKPEADKVLEEFRQALSSIFSNYKTIDDAFSKMEELKSLKQKFFACAAGSEEEKEVRNRIRDMIREK